MTANRTSQAVETMAKNAKKGFVVLNDVAPVTAKYRKMERALGSLAKLTYRLLGKLDDKSPKELRDAIKAMQFDPLSDSSK